MKDQPVVTLKKLIAQHGKNLTNDARRTEALLNDLCPDYRREVFVLVNAQRQRVPADLLAAPEWMPIEAVSGRLSRRLQDRLAFSEEAADWAVQSWASALGLQQRPTALGRLLHRIRTGLQVVSPDRSIEASKRQTGQCDVQSSVQEGSAGAAPGALPARARPEDAVRSWKKRTFAWLAIGVSAVTLVWAFTYGLPVGRTEFTLLDTARSPSRIAQHVYELPRMAWVSEGPLLVRAGPAMSEDTLTMLEAGQSVRVIGFSSDVQWSRIAQPLEGWVSNWYLNFLSPDELETPVQVLHRPMRAAGDGAPVYALPSQAGEAISYLDAGVATVAIATTVDGEWRHIARPVRGWVMSRNLVPDVE